MWDGDQLVYESGVTAATYIRGLSLIARVAESSRDYYLYDGHGNVVGLADSADTLSRSYEYDAFGNQLNIDPTDPNPFRYCGEYYDAETGSYYLRARYYDSSIGRFTQEDPHWNTGNMVYGDDPAAMSRGLLDLEAEYYLPSVLAMRQCGNLYVYAINNPNFYVDPSGEAILFAPIVVGALIGGVVSAALNIHGQITDPNTTINKLNLPSVGISFLTGAVSGAIAGSPIGKTGQIVANTFLGGLDTYLQGKVSNEAVSLSEVLFASGIGTIVGFVGGEGAQYSKIVYTKITNTGDFFSGITKTYSKQVSKTAALKALLRGTTYGASVQFLLSEQEL